MEITLRDLVTALHGMGFGALFMLAFSGAIAEMYRMAAPGAPEPGARSRRLLYVYLGVMVILAWATVLSGTYIIYPWYRAVPPAGVTDITLYPKALLLSSPSTAEWHNLGMEWKEHVGWIAPIAMTMVAYIFAKYGRLLARERQVRLAAFVFVVVAFVATAVAGAFGAFLNKYAPIRGGPTITILQGEQ
ncbi:hypothetical protein HY968_03320 [Candidatus Kaiserbacteria bacterium]|nr:hypothetical protein [Candidatus Kaiserbacteria bacterium]